jgi:peptidyl-prolyl cis-trans isomerase C
LNVSQRTLPRLGATAVLISTLAVGLACGRDEAGASAPATETQASAPANAPAATPAAPAPAAAPATPNAQPAAPPADPPLAAEQIPLVVARIDGLDVTREDLLARAAEARGAIADRGFQQPAATRSFYRKVLDDIVGNRLLYADLKAKGQTVPAADVDKRLAEIKGQFPSPQEFEKALTARGFDETRLRRDLEEGMTVQRWFQGTVAPSVEVPEAEIRKFYDSNPEQMKEPESVVASHVLVAVPQTATAEEKAAKRQRAEELRARIVAGEDLAKVASEASDDPGSKVRGGSLDRVYRGQTVPQFETAAFALEPGALSQVVETPFGFHLIRVSEKKPAGTVAFERVKERIGQLLRQRAVEEKVRETVQALAARAKVEILL